MDAPRATDSYFHGDRRKYAHRSLSHALDRGQITPRQPIYIIIAYVLIMPAKTASGLTTVALNREHHERLYNYKSANRCRSMDEAIGLLLDTVESSRSLSPCAR